MDGSWILKKVYELVQSVDIYQTDSRLLIQQMEPHLRELATQQHVAALDICLIEPNECGADGRENTIEYQFNDFDPLDPQKICFSDDRIGQSFVRISLYPPKNRPWTDEEREEVMSVVRLVVTEINRTCLIRHFNEYAYMDILTGIYNRFGAEYFGNQIFSSAECSEYVGCYLDLKNFKLFNEQYGYTAADTMLVQYAKKLQTQMEPEKEIAARIGCDRFLTVICKERLPQFLEMAKNAFVSITYNQKQISVPVDAWIGIYPVEQGDKFSVVLSRASFASEQAKKKKRPMMYFSSTQLGSAMREKMIAQMLPAAIENGEVAPYYQAKVRLSDGVMVGCEALARWTHEGMSIPPKDFILNAEQYGIVDRLDLYILECVCRDIREWLDAGLNPVCVSVNYSQQNFYRKSLIEDTLRLLEKYQIEGKYIEIEFTETSFLELPEALNAFVEAMHVYGVKVALDDFGIGYSSLSLFSSLSLDTVKLDKSFIDDLKSADDKKYLILQSITEMIHRQNVVTVAEGIENAAQLQLIRDIGGRVVQGFFLDHPLPKEEFEHRLQHRQHHKSILDAYLQ